MKIRGFFLSHPTLRDDHLNWLAKVQPPKGRPDNVFYFLADIVRSPFGCLQKFFNAALKFLTVRLDLEFALAVISGHQFK